MADTERTVSRMVPLDVDRAIASRSCQDETAGLVHCSERCWDYRSAHLVHKAVENTVL